MSTRTVSVELQARVGQYTSSMDRAAKSTATTDTAVQKAAKSTEGMSRRMQLAGVVAAGALAVGMRRAIDAASDLEETQSKVNVIFGDSSAKISEYAETSAQALGQSKQQAMAAAATFAVFGKSAGLTGDELADFSTDFTTLASDLASFNNTSPEEAIQAIGAALRGEAEPIRAYGVMLDDATLKQEALSLGIIKTTKEALTPQQKVLAAQEAIYKQTKDAQGDFGRTSDGLANQQRILAAEFQNVQAQLGQFLLPYAKTAVSVLGDLLGRFSDLAPATQRTVVQVVLLGVSAAAAAPKIAEAASSATDFFRTMDRGRADLIATSAGLAAIAAILVTSTNSMSQFGKEIESALGEFKKSGSDEALDATIQKVEALRQKQEDLRSSTSVWDLLSDVAEGTGWAITSGFQDLGDAVSEYEDRVVSAAREQNAAYMRAARVLDLPIEKVRDLAEVSGVDLTQGIGRSSDALIEYYNTSVRSKSVTDKQAEAQATLADEFANGEDKVKAFRQELDMLDNGFLDLDEARDRAKGAVLEFEEGLKENGRTLDSNTRAGQANKENLRNIAETAKGAADSVFALVEPTKGVAAAQGRANQELATGRENFIKAAIAAGRTRRQAELLADKYGLIPTAVATKATFDSKTAEAGLASWIAKLQAGPTTSAAAVPGSPAYRNRERRQNNLGRATGGPVVAGQQYSVNERQPEWLQLSRDGLSGYIRPTRPVERQSRGGVTVAEGAVQVSLAGTNLGLADVRREVNGALQTFVRELEDL